jgi:phosphoglycerol transferase MdoB-like AlkP superfamily enzyme
MLDPEGDIRSAACAGSMSDTRPTISVAEAISLATLAIGLLTVLLYVAGWAYAYYYFDRFRIPFLLLDFPFQHYVVYGGLIIYKSLWISLPLLVLAFVALWSAWHWINAIGRIGFIAAVIALVLAAFTLARFGGISVARADFAAERANDYAAYPRIHVVLDANASGAEKVLGDIVSQDCGRLLAGSKDNLFLIRPIRGAPNADLDTFVVPVSKMVVSRIRSDAGSCP